MDGNGDTLDVQRLKHPHLAAVLTGLPKKEPHAEVDEEGEEACPAFGYLRGVRDRALTLEFRLRTGNTESFPYSWLGPVSFNPSAGLLLKFTGDLVYLCLIRGSNLDAVPPPRTVNLTDRGINRHRVVWVREMDEDEIRRAGEGEATIDQILLGQFESNEEQCEWLTKVAPAFVRKLK